MNEKKETLKDFWHEGAIQIPLDEKVIAKYWVKSYDEPSVFGINEGRISKLEIRIKGKITARYDRGWDIEIAQEDTATQLLFDLLMQDYN